MPNAWSKAKHTHRARPAIIYPTAHARPVPRDIINPHPGREHRVRDAHHQMDIMAQRPVRHPPQSQIAIFQVAHRTVGRFRIPVAAARNISKATVIIVNKNPRKGIF